VQLDLDPVRPVVRRLVEDDMPAGDEEETLLALEEEAGRPGQGPLAVKRRDSRGGEQEGFDHGIGTSKRRSLVRRPVQEGRLMPGTTNNDDRFDSLALRQVAANLPERCCRVPPPRPPIHARGRTNGPHGC
jgi:hypothetical protein